MSLATDLGMAQPMEQGLGICLLAVRFGEELGLADAELQRIFDTALLRHVGCTAEAAAFAEIMGDELVARSRGGSFVDWARPTAAFGYVAGQIVRTHTPLRAASRLARLPAAMAACARARSPCARSRACSRSGSEWTRRRAGSS